MVKLGDNGTLAELYAQLTGAPAAAAWSAFKAAIDGRGGAITTDDPFNALSEAT